MWRNRFANGFKFIFGITPISDRYYWVDPSETGWRREYPRPGYARWVKQFGPIKVVLPYWDGVLTINFFGRYTFQREWAIGWKARGALGGAFRPYHAEEN